MDCSQPVTLSSSDNSPVESVLLLTHGNDLLAINGDAVDAWRFVFLQGPDTHDVMLVLGWVVIAG